MRSLIIFLTLKLAEVLAVDRHERAHLEGAVAHDLASRAAHPSGVQLRHGLHRRGRAVATLLVLHGRELGGAVHLEQHHLLGV